MFFTELALSVTVPGVHSVTPLPSLKRRAAPASLHRDFARPAASPCCRSPSRWTRRVITVRPQELVTCVAPWLTA